jgi:uncharacterized membrane protein
MKWIGTGAVLFITLASWSAPYLMRRDLLFGVTVLPGFSDTSDARRIARRYQIQVLLFGLAAVMMGLLMPHNDRLSIRWMIPVLLLGIGNSIAYGQAHTFSRAHAVQVSGVREVELVPRSRSLFESPLMLLAGPAIVALGFAFAFLKPDQAGEVPLLAGWAAMVARWNAINALVEKPLSFSLGAVLGSILPLLGFRFGTRRSPVGTINYRQVLLRNIILFNASFAALAVWAMGSGLFGRVVDQIEFRLALVLIGLGLAAHITYLLLLRRKENVALASATGHPLGDRTPDESWLWGMFYHNADDPALFVEARTGPGYTINFGHLRAWLIAAAFLSAPLLALLFR